MKTVCPCEWVSKIETDVIEYNDLHMQIDTLLLNSGADCILSLKYVRDVVEFASRDVHE